MHQRLEDLKPGLILAADLVETGGRLLLPGGTVLTDRHLRYFQMWGIVAVDIEGDADAEPVTPMDPTVRAAIEARLTALFRHADLTHPAVAQVYAHCLARDLRRSATPSAHAI